MAKFLPSDVLMGRSFNKPLFCPFQSGSVVGTPCDMGECALFRVVKRGNEVVAKGCVFQVSFDMQLEALGKVVER